MSTTRHGPSRWSTHWSILLGNLFMSLCWVLTSFILEFQPSEKTECPVVETRELFTTCTRSSTKSTREAGPQRCPCPLRPHLCHYLHPNPQHYQPLGCHLQYTKWVSRSKKDWNQDSTYLTDSLIFSNLFSRCLLHRVPALTSIVSLL